MVKKSLSKQPPSQGSDLEHVVDDLRNRAYQQEIVARLGQQALTTPALPALMDEAVSLVANTLKIEYCKVLELLPKGEALLLRAGIGWQEGLVGRAKVEAESDSQAGYTLLSSEPVIVVDLKTESRFHGPKLLLDHGVVSGMSVIIQGKTRPFGVLGAHSQQHRIFTKDDIHFLQSVANILAAAIENQRVRDEMLALNHTLERRVRERTALIHLLQDITVAANEFTTVEAAIQSALKRVCDYTGWPVGYARMLDRKSEAKSYPINIWHFDASDRLPWFREMPEQRPRSPEVGLLGRVLAKGQPVWISDMTDSAHFSGANLAQEIGLKAGFAFPVRVGKEIVAVFEFFTDEAIEGDAALMEVIKHIGTQLGRVIERERGQQALRKNEELYRTLVRNLPDMAVLLFDYNLRYIIAEGQALIAQGYHKSILEGKTIWDIFPIERARQLAPYYQATLDGKENVFEWLSNERVYLIHTLPVKNERRQTFAGLLVMHDITDQKQLETELIEVQHRLMGSREDERLQIAQEIHDGPLQNLHSISYKLNEVWDTLSDEASQSQILTAQVSLQRTIKALRVLCVELRPPTLAPFGVEKAIRSHIEEFQQSHPELTIHLELMADGQSLSEQVRMAIFRIHQQALDNIAKHAGECQVTIRFTFDSEQIKLEVEDDGKGFEVPKRRVELARQGHLGVVGAAERAEAMGGRLQVKSAPGEGTLIRAIIPRKGGYNSGLPHVHDSKVSFENLGL